MGTLLALLVFLSIFGIFVTEYLPLWMTDNESAFGVTVANQFGQIDEEMGSLYLAAQSANGQSHFAAANPVTMSSASVPIFTQPTYGVLSFSGSAYPATLYANATFDLQGHRGQSSVVATSGALQMALKNRYYVPLTYSLEDGAVVSSQSASQQSLIFDPSVITNSSGSASTLDLTLFSVYGNTTTATSTGTQQVYTTYITSSTYQGANSGTPVWLNFTTLNPCAWFQYWHATTAALNNSNFPTHPSVWSNSTAGGACSSSNAVNSPKLLSVYFPMITFFNLAVVTFDMAVGTASQP